MCVCECLGVFVYACGTEREKKREITCPVCDVNSSNSSKTKRMGVEVEESPTLIESKKNFNVSEKEPRSPRGIFTFVAPVNNHNNNNKHTTS